MNAQPARESFANASVMPVVQQQQRRSACAIKEEQQRLPHGGELGLSQRAP